MFPFFTLFYLFNVEKITPTFNSFLFKKSFYQKDLLTKLSSPNISAREKLRSIRDFDLTMNDSEFKMNLWKDLNIYDF